MFSKITTILFFLFVFTVSSVSSGQTVEGQKVETQGSGTQSSKGMPTKEDLARLHPDEPIPVSPSELESSIQRGVDYLLSSQREDGAWGGPQWTGGVDSDPVPGSFRSFEIAVTAMCLEALLDAKNSPAIELANERALKYLMDRTHKIKRAGPGDLPHIWAHCYCIQTFSKMYERETDETKREEFSKAILAHMKGLKRWESVHGGWFYYGSGMAKPINPSCSFVNAAVLVALARAREIGLDADENVVRRAVRSTKMMRKPDSSYLYSARIPTDMAGAAREINRPSGSLGRSQACNIALRMWNDERIDDDVIRVWLDRLISRHGWLDMGRKKPIPHESFAAVAGYFYYFGVYYGTVNIEVLPEGEQAFYQHHLAKIVMDRQEKDGSWFDYPLYSYHKPYGTAFALLSLQRCQIADTKD